jgi:hypothetical protein
MDKIYFLAREGEITGGTHSYLLSQNPTYKEFFHNQTEVEISNI